MTLLRHLFVSSLNLFDSWQLKIFLWKEKKLSNEVFSAKSAKYLFISKSQTTAHFFKKKWIFGSILIEINFLRKLRFSSSNSSFYFYFRKRNETKKGKISIKIWHNILLISDSIFSRHYLLCIQLFVVDTDTHFRVFPTLKNSNDQNERRFYF